MLEKGRISAFQMGLMLFPTVLATSLLSQPASAAQYAANDYWMTGLIAALPGFLTVFVMTRLQKLYPKMNFIEYCEQIVGKWLGRMIGLCYMMFLLTVSGGLTRQYTDFVTGNFLFKTPALTVTAGMVLLTAMAIRGGIEVLARSAVVILPIFIVPLAILLLLIPDMDMKNALPVFSHGLVPVMKGAASPAGWVCEYFLMAYLLPYAVDQDKGWKWGSLSMAAVIFFMTYLNVITLFTFGLDTADKTYPILVAFRYISAANFFENLESLLLAMWVAGNFIKLGVFYYATVLTFGQFFRMSEYKPIVLPIGIAIVLSSMWGLPDYTAFAAHLRLSAPLELTAFFFVIPTLLLAIAAVRRKPTAGGSGGSG